MLKMVVSLMSVSYVEQLMRAYEREVKRVYDKTVFTFSRNVGPRANKNYKLWARLAGRMIENGWLPTAFMHHQVRRFHAGQSYAGAELKPPFISMLGSAKSLASFEKYTQTPAFRRWLDTPDLDLALLELEIQDGGVLLGKLGAALGMTGDGNPLVPSFVLQSYWTGMPSGFLAISRDFRQLASNTVGTAIIPQSAPAKFAEVCGLMTTVDGLPAGQREQLLDLYDIALSDASAIAAHGG